MATVAVLAVIVIAVIIAVVKVCRDKANGKCTGCSCAGTCHKHFCSKEN